MPPIVLEVVVNAQGVVTGLRTVDQAVADTTKGVQQTGQATAQATQSTQAYGSSLGASTKNALQFAGALTGIQLGFSTVGTVVQSTASAVLDFNAAMANVNTIAGRSREVQEQLRQEVLKLPPELLSSTEAAKGLYEVISAGVEPTKAVAFLKDAAMLAKAGLADMDTTVQALTKSMAAYNIPAEKAGEVSDIIFKTVELGQGTLKEFAGALPQVTQLSAALGVSFVDTNAIMATLTQTFKNADTAATGYRSLLVQLVQNSDKFAAVGVNIQQVIGEQGFVGVLRVLQELTGGNSEKMKQYVSDVEGLSAALALTKPQFQLLLDNQKKFAASTGVVQEAVKTQTETTKASLSALANAFTTYATAINTESSLATKVLQAFTKGFADHTKGVVESEARIRAWRAEQERARQEAEKSRKTTQDQTSATERKRAADEASLKAFSDVTFAYLTQGSQASVLTLTTEQLGDEYRSTAGEAATLATNLTTQLDPALTKNGTSASGAERAMQQLQTELTGLNAAIKAIKPGETPTLIDAADLERNVQTATAALEHLRDSGKINFRELAASAAALREAMRERFGQIPADAEQLFTSITDRARAADLPGVFDRIGVESRAALQRSFLEQVKDFEAAVASQQVPAHQLLTVMLELGEQLPKAAFDRLPPEAKRVFDQIPALLAQASAEAVRAGEQLPAQYQLKVLRVLETMQRQHYATVVGIVKTGEGDKITAIVDANDRLSERLKVINTARVNEDGKQQQSIIDHHKRTLEYVETSLERGAEKAKTFLGQTGQDYVETLTTMAGGLSKGIANVDAQLALVHQKIVARQRETDAILAKTFRLTEDLTKGLQGPVVAFSEVLREVTAAQIEYGNNYAVALDEVTLRAAKDYGLISQAALDMALATKRANAEARESNEEYGASVRKAKEETDTYKASVNALSDATKALMALRIDIKTPFGTTINQLTDQLRQAQQDLLDLGTRIGDLGFAGYEKQRKVLEDLITELEKRIADLQKQQTTATGTLTGTGTTGTGTLTGTGTTGTGTGTLTGTLTGTGTRPPSSGSSFAPTSPTALIRPGAPLAPTGPTPQRPASPQALPVATQRGGVTYQMVIHTQAQDAATLARDLVPYLRQADLSRRQVGG